MSVISDKISENPIRDLLADTSIVSSILRTNEVGIVMIEKDTFKVTEKCTCFDKILGFLDVKDGIFLDYFEFEERYKLKEYLTKSPNEKSIICKTGEYSGSFSLIKICLVKQTSDHFVCSLVDVSFTTELKANVLTDSLSAISGNHPWFKVIRDQVPYSMSVTSPEGKFVAINQHFLNLLGLKEEDVIGRDRLEVLDLIDYDVVDLESMTAMFVSINEAVIRGQKFQKRFIVRNPVTQSVLNVEHNGYPLFKGNDYLGYVSITIDVSAVRPEFQELKDKIEYSTGVMDALNTQMNIVKADGTILFANTPWIMCLTNTHDNVSKDILASGMANIKDYYDEEYLAKNYFEPMQDIIQGNVESAKTTLTVENPDGSKVFYVKKCSPLWNAKGQIEAFSNIFSDITDYLTVIEENKEKDELVQLFQTTFGLGYWTVKRVDGDLCVEYSDEMQNLTQRDKGPHKIQDLINAMDYAPEDDPSKNIIVDKKIILDNFHPDFLSTFSEGQEHTISYRRRIPGGNIRNFKSKYKRVNFGSTEFIGMTYDNTQELKNIQIEKSKARFEVLDKLVAGIAHEINNYTQGMLSAVELANEEIYTIKEVFSIVESYAEKAKKLTNGLMNYSKSQVFDFGNSKVNVADSINETILLAGAMLKSTVDLSISIQPELPLIDMSESHLKDAIFNCILNAKSAIEDADKNDGNIKIQVEEIVAPEICHDKQYLGSFNEDINYIKVSIQDNGIGMTEKTLEKCTDIFFTTRESGMGLGTSALHSLAQVSCVVEISSKFNEGSQFSLYLPLVNIG